MLAAAGWRVVHSENIRPRTKPTQLVYKQRFLQEGGADWLANHSSGADRDAMQQHQLSVLWDQVKSYDPNEWSWGATFGLVDIVAVPVAAEAEPEKAEVAGCDLSSVEQQLSALLRQTTDVDSLAANADRAGTRHTFGGLLSCVLGSLRRNLDETTCPDPDELARSLLLTSTKVFDGSATADGVAFAQSNRYAVFLAPEIVGAEVAVAVARECLTNSLNAPPQVRTALATATASNILCVSVEWPSKFSAKTATGRFYISTDAETSAIASWEWELLQSGAATAPPASDYKAGAVTRRDYTKSNGAEACRGSGWVDTSSPLDMRRLAAASAAEITACWAVSRGDKAVAKRDFKLADGAVLRDVLPAVKLPVSLTSSPALGASLDAAVAMVATQPGTATFYFGSGPIGAASSAGQEDHTIASSDASNACSATSAQLVSPAPGRVAPDSAVTLGQLFGLDAANAAAAQAHVGDSFWHATTDGGLAAQLSWRTIEASVEAAFAASADALPDDLFVAYKRDRRDVAAENGPQTAAEMFRMLRAPAPTTAAGDALSAVVHGAHLLSELPAVSGIREGLERIFASPVNVNLYLSAAGAATLPGHTDRYDVFVVQLQGSKRWNVCPPNAGHVAGAKGLSQADAAIAAEIKR